MHRKWKKKSCTNLIQAKQPDNQRLGSRTSPPPPTLTSVRKNLFELWENLCEIEVPGTEGVNVVLFVVVVVLVSAAPSPSKTEKIKSMYHCLSCQAQFLSFFCFAFEIKTLFPQLQLEFCAKDVTFLLLLQCPRLQSLLNQEMLQGTQLLREYFPVNPEKTIFPVCWPFSCS